MLHRTIAVISIVWSLYAATSNSVGLASMSPLRRPSIVAGSAHIIENGGTVRLPGKRTAS